MVNESEFMKPFPVDAFKNLKNDIPEGAPECEIVNIKKLSSMIAKKTKFRKSDVSEVLNELGDAIYSILLERKGIDLGGVMIVSEWVPLDKPRYIRRGRTCDKDVLGKWTYGYFYPSIKMDIVKRKMYRGVVSPNCSQEFVDDMNLYLEDNLTTAEEVAKFSMDVMEETSSYGRNVLIDNNGFFKSNGRYFDETFHPTYIERIKFSRVSRHAFKMYNDLIKKDPNTPILRMDFVNEEIRKAGLKPWADRKAELSEILEKFNNKEEADEDDTQER